ncbi:AAA family ATPase [Nocardia noduli]|uniref:AAA family ATPase n=1 Tax=Nocardia noduli TaxID=2815722 RepID=UPI0027DFCE28|nr:AAA family ATPase [Nocardia noduli]
MPPFRSALTHLLQARFPLLFVESFEEQRVLDEIDAAVAGLKTPRALWRWSATEGLRRAGGPPERETHAPAAMLQGVARVHERAVFVLSDLHAFLGDGTQQADPLTVRALRDVVRDFRAGELARTVIVVAPVLRIPPELEKDVTVVDFALPGEPEIRDLLEGMIIRNRDTVHVALDERGRDRLTKAALGMTLAEAENAVSLAMVNGSALTESDVELVLAEKAQTIRKTGLLELVRSEIDLADVGGLDALKSWLDKRRDSWLAEAAAYGLPAPKGVLITGVPGCGKSLTAKAAAAAWGLPLIRMDIGRVFAGLVGASEHNMRSALATAEACAPCVLWVDEIDKGFAGAGTASDTGTSARVFGTFLTWLQEKTGPVFVIATANRIENLPPEFLRKGRFDEIFFVDLPDSYERADIWRLHLTRRPAGPAGGPELTPELLRELAGISEGFSGAEIEQAVVSGLFEAYFDRRALTAADLLHAVRNTVPLSTLHAAQVTELREWAKLRAVPASRSLGNDGLAPE